jgi:hypothetical protein
MALRTGTVGTAPFRIKDTSIPQASVYANEALGGWHTRDTLVQRNNIALHYRQWGMICVVTKDSVISNNSVYQLVYKNVNEDITDNLNWVPVTFGTPDVSGAFESKNIIFYASPNYYTVADAFYYVNSEINKISKFYLVYTTLDSSSNIDVRIHTNTGVELLSEQTLTTADFQDGLNLKDRLVATESQIQIAEFNIIKPSENCLIEIQIRSDIDMILKNIIIK